MTDALHEAAEQYQRDTGVEPFRFREAVKAGAGHQGQANALLADLDWYRRHTESVHQILRRAINRAL